ncbi:MAG: hypothetical protein J6U05_02480, partial [Neisseriaceae bacterium]|nr:hypothetical protein [Neisseriaceae bacterium]
FRRKNRGNPVLPIGKTQRRRRCNAPFLIKFRQPECFFCNVVKNAYRRLLKPAVLTGLPRFDFVKSRNDTVSFQAA